MTVNLNEALVKIKAAGPNKVRSVPMPNQNVHTGFYQIEILEGASWTKIVEMIPKETANNLIAQATNRTICG